MLLLTLATVLLALLVPPTSSFAKTELKPAVQPQPE
jgi:hypothetical protein